MLDSLQRELVVVSGKGGVGKTTVAAALAYDSARSGARTLLARADPHDRAWHLFSDHAPDIAGKRSERDVDQMRNIIPNLDVVDIRPDAALREYGAMVLRSRRLYSAVFENRLVASFLRGTPGIYAWATLGKVCFHINPDMVGSAPDASQHYDRVIFDGPATGHMLDMVRVPLVIRRTASGGLLRRGAEGALDVLSDPARTSWVVVSTAEPFSVREASELARSLVSEFPEQDPIGLLNQWQFERLQGARLEAARALPASATNVGYAHLVRRVARREQEQRLGLQGLEEVFAKVLRMPNMDGAPLASALANSLQNGDHRDRERGPT